MAKEITRKEKQITELYFETTLGNDKIGVITRINNVLESMKKMLERNEQKLQNLELQYKNAKETLSISFA